MLFENKTICLFVIWSITQKKDWNRPKNFATPTVCLWKVDRLPVDYQSYKQAPCLCTNHWYIRWLTNSYNWKINNNMRGYFEIEICGSSHFSVSGCSIGNIVCNFSSMQCWSLEMHYCIYCLNASASNYLKNMTFIETVPAGCRRPL